MNKNDLLVKIVSASPIKNTTGDFRFSEIRNNFILNKGKFKSYIRLVFNNKKYKTSNPNRIIINAPRNINDKDFEDIYKFFKSKRIDITYNELVCDLFINNNKIIHISDYLKQNKCDSNIIFKYKKLIQKNKSKYINGIIIITKEENDIEGFLNEDNWKKWKPNKVKTRNTIYIDTTNDNGFLGGYVIYKRNFNQNIQKSTRFILRPFKEEKTGKVVIVIYGIFLQ